MNTEMATLTGAYTLDALSDTERVAFERHLASCDDCAEEVDQLTETAARLGRTTAVTPPAELKQRVLAEISHTRQEPPRSAAPHGAPKRRPFGAMTSRRWVSRLSAVAAVLGIALAATFGGLAWQKQQELNQARAVLEQRTDANAAMGKLLHAPDANIAIAGEGSMEAITVSSERMDKAMFLGSGMGPTPPKRVYQLWFVGAYGAHSAGLLKPDTGGGMAPVMSAVPRGTTAMAVTVEPTGGSPQPTSDPVLRMSMSQ